MPRKSLPAPKATPIRVTVQRGQTSTPAGAGRRTNAKAGPGPSTSARKRKRPVVRDVDDDLESLTADDAGPTVGPDGPGDDTMEPGSEVFAGVEPMDPEKELEQWQDFAVDHYEMVEQLPLELHRNYRLLRELDDEVLTHSATLQDAIREYIALRLKMTAPKPMSPAIEPGEAPPLPSLTLNGDVLDAENPSKPPLSMSDLPTPIPDGAGGQVVPPPEPLVTDTMDMDVDSIIPDPTSGEPTLPLVDDDADADAEGEIVEVEQVVEARRAFPSVSPDRPEADVLPPQAIRHDSPASAQPEARTGEMAWKLLPRIAKLAKDMVKNGEEKVAVAQGAYNSIDRHIRALDSALSAQEASILLGLRPHTGPSALVGDSLNLVGDTGAQLDDQPTVIGIGGARRKGRASRNGRAGARGRGAGAAGAGQENFAGVAVAGAEIPREILDADPNEPRYCYCNQVSYGEMIGCENDDCPIEWFHLACTGLITAPSGAWLCNKCKPAIGLGKGGAGKVAPRAGAARPKGRASRGRSSNKPRPSR